MAVLKPFQSHRGQYYVATGTMIDTKGAHETTFYYNLALLLFLVRNDSQNVATED